MPDLQNIASHNGTELLQSLFRPNASKSEVEDVHFDLPDVVTLELQIDPGRHDKEVLATLQTIQIFNSAPH